VANLTLGKKKYAAAEAELRDVRDRAIALRVELVRLARLDSEAFEAVLRARRLPSSTPEQVAARDEATALAELEATRVPLRTAEACIAVAELATRAARSGNPNAVTDAGVAGGLAAAAAEGALLNVKINLKSLGTSADKNDIEKALPRLEQASVAAARSCSEAVRAGLNA
jgi:glutamate formiminotransferase/formiminotetrahydrofolate cyclodeaminase